jgi:hypothetical protein
MKNSKNYLNLLFRSGVKLFESPWGSLISAGIIYLIVSAFAGNLFRQSEHPYYNYLADAFLHGQPSLRQIPRSIHDLIYYQGNYYLYWPPFPAILLIPFVAVFGVQLNDVLFTVIIASLNVGLFAQLLRVACKVKFLELTNSQRAILVFFLAFGTVHFTLAPYGKVWMTGQLIGFSCVLLSYLSAFSLKGVKAWLFTSIPLACAMLTRNHLVFTGIFPFVYLILHQWPRSKKDLIRNAVLGLIPISFALVFYLSYNQVRFGNPLDTGVHYHLMHEFFRADYEQYGLFSIQYVPTNFYYQFVFYPLPIRSESLMGGSIFLLSPLFFGVFSSFRKPRSKIYTAALVASVIVTSVPILMLMGTGWIQFGPRYTLDFTVPLLLLTALGIEKWKLGLSFVLTIISVIHYTIGVAILR